jgi:lactate permease
MDNIIFLALLGALPIVLVFILLVFYRWPAIQAMALGWILASILGIFIWEVDLNRWAATAIFGGFQAVEIILIIFGAILLMGYLEKGGALITIRKHFTGIQSDRRIQLLLIGYGFITIIEGVAGFGTPAALAAPLLIGLGFPPLAAAVFGLWFNAPNPPFGVVGLPTAYGVGSVIDKVIPTSVKDSFMPEVFRWVGLFTGFAYVFWGFLAIVLLIYWFGNNEERNIKRAIKSALPVAPFAFVMGVTAGVLDWSVAYFIGPELPDIIVGFGTFAIGILMSRRGLLVPKKNWDFPEKKIWSNLWLGGLTNNDEQGDTQDEEKVSVLKAWFPYLMVAGFLFITRLPWLHILDYLKGFSLGIRSIMGTELSFALKPLYLPGIMPFIPVALITGLMFNYKKGEIKGIWRKAVQRVLPAALTLIISVSMAQIMINSDLNNSDLPGMMNVLSIMIANFAGKALPLVTPWIGVLGAFMTGSNTSSNILFSVMQYGAAENIGISRTITVAMQSTGGGIGNLISVLNIAAIAGVLGMNGREGDILRKTIIPTLIYALFIGLIGMLFVYLIAPDVF